MKQKTNKSSQFKQWILSIVSAHFCFHKYETFRVGAFPLVAAYCRKCGRVKFGNCIYYDGSTYQDVYKGEEAMNFISKFAEYLKRRNKIMVDFEKQTGKNLCDYKEKAYRDEYETIDRYNEIVSALTNER